MKKNKNLDKLNFQILILTLWIILWFPQLQFKYELKLEQLLSLVSFSICVFSLIILKKKIKLKHIFIIALFLLLLLISLLRNSLENIILNDFFELFKPFYLGAYFLISYSINWDILKIKKIISHLIFCLFLLCLFGYFESLTTLGNNIGHFLYKDLRPGVQYKAVASFISPYVFASILLIPTFIYFSNLFINFNLSNILYFIFFLTGFLLTQSRTVFLAFIITIILYTFYVAFSNKYLGKRNYIGFIIITFILSSILTPFIILFIQNYLPYLYSGLNVLFSNIINFELERFVNSSPSISHRYYQLEFVINKIDFIPIFGVGIGKADLMPESFYALYLYRVGIIGLFIHLSFIFYSFYKSGYLANYFKHDKRLHCIFIGLQMYFLSLPFSYASSALNDQVRSGFIFYLLFGLLIKYNPNNIKEVG
ncbi:O-antigen ligase family protein [Proteus mirabilis]|uniref:O-antigen ligase family protein n=2 Tax=Proteus mirabilis TaxID=584 RepID=UPI0015837971|nr:O-antigen ligase family protein [Proteus mirabilis]EKX4458054.1 O-antigen ligase family protein [Proteus mirabilis]EKX4632925.1 O-antigen ligase family protein [Proteus mirabilis]ELB4967004.1 O-antigen ligase family protein [Proteus mirabilis]ELI8995184.1 O-antigen ligase family protein [Proteus mirabilis]MCY9777425.1 O-antigen ligase family protein [Proteus mirabilis]